MKILVTGSNGLVGNAIVRCLKKHNFENLFTPSRSELDLESIDKVTNYINDLKPEFIFNAAGLVGGVSVNNLNRTDFIYKNTLMQFNVIFSAHKLGLKSIINFGSSCIYPKFSNLPIQESSLLAGKLEDTNEPYAIAKIAGLKLCESINRDFNKNFITLMPTNLYGPNDNYDLEKSHVLPALLLKAHKCKIEKNKDFIIWGNGKSFREFLYVDDLAEASVFIMKNLNKISLNIINIGSGMEIAIDVLAKKIIDIVGINVKIKYDETKPNGVKSKLIDSSIINQLGWFPKVSLDEGIELTYKDFLSNK
jgi:GDP-L-fucose synthase